VKSSVVFSAVLSSEEATVAAGRNLASAMIRIGCDSLIVHLTGDLGAGKTTFARGFLRELGHTGRVPSPTYTLIEPYSLTPYRVYHIDLYRLSEGSEVIELALFELVEPGAVILIEWPERGAGRIPSADLEVQLGVLADGRAVRLVSHSDLGRSVLEAAKQDVRPDM
jgi:tRNA threonylcarbamoyladenosine biosynthesis protein TsaE